MKVIVVLDDQNGMMFNNRRQSQDMALRSRILDLTKESKLWMNEYTAKQFECVEQWMRVDNLFLDKAGVGEYCFVENESLLQVKDKIEEMIIFRWNRRYPGDRFLDANPETLGMTCKYIEEFEGTSHEKITMEVWGLLVNA
ncbi:MAG: ribonuclease Z [Lachnospiraceae bacterium]|nr:ribonuclease Z [Lachnospiraceae bacterium]